MKAWCITAIGKPEDVLQRLERTEPGPGPGEVQIEVAAAGLGLPDVLMCRGKYAFSPELPFVPGQELAGVVTRVGEGAAFSPGDRVMGVSAFYGGNGGFAQYCLAPDFSLYPIPAGMTDTQAAGFTIPFHTAWIGLQVRASLQRGETVLVHGAAGGSGAAAIKLAKAMGATVIASASSKAKLDLCAAMGADHCINYVQEHFVERVQAITGQRGVDVVYDPVGGEVFEQSVDVLASGGRLLAVGYASGRWGVADGRQLVARNAAAIGVYVGAYDHSQMLQHHSALGELFEQGEIDCDPDAVISFDEIGEYLARMSNRESLGKIVAAY